MKHLRLITKSKDSAGMSMVEVVFASTVLLGAILIMVSMFDMATKIFSYTTYRSIATQIDNEMLEDMRSMDYEQVANEIPTDWPDDPNLSTEGTPLYKDIDDDGNVIWREVVTTTSPALQIDNTVARKNINFTVRKYVLWVDDSSTTHAYKRLVVNVTWPSYPMPGTVIMSTNYAKSDSREPRPSVAIRGIRSTNYNYFIEATEDTTLGQDDTIRGPYTDGDYSIHTPQVYAQASVNSAKATGIDRVNFSLTNPNGNFVTSDTVMDPTNGYYIWDLPTNTSSTPDDNGYLIQAEAVDSLGRSEVTAMRINIDNTCPIAVSNLDVADFDYTKRMLVTWDWEGEKNIRRFLIMRREAWGHSFTLRAAVPNIPTSDNHYSFMDADAPPHDHHYAWEYKVIAVDDAGNRLSDDRDSGIKDRWLWGRIDLTNPNAVSETNAAPASWKAIDLAWPQTTDNIGGSGLYGYLISGSDDGVNWTIIGETTDTLTDPLYRQDAGLLPGKTYYYNVVSFDFAGNTSTPGPVISATTRWR